MLQLFLSNLLVHLTDAEVIDLSITPVAYSVEGGIGLRDLPFRAATRLANRLRTSLAPFHWVSDGSCESCIAEGTSFPRDSVGLIFFDLQGAWQML